MREKGPRRPIAILQVLFYACILSGEGCKEQPPAPTAYPQFLLASEVYDLGAIREEDGVARFSFSFRNAGGVPLTIGKVASSCGCVTGIVSRKSVFLPGESGKIDVELDPRGRSGRMAHELFVESNDPEDPQKRLKITADIVASLFFEPGHLQMGTVLRGQSTTMTVSLYSRDPSFSVGSVSADHASVSARAFATRDVLLGSEKLRLTPIDVTLAATAGLGLVNCRVTTNASCEDDGSAHRASLGFSVSAYVVPDIVCRPPSFSVSQREAASPFVASATLTSRSDTTFKILEIMTQAHPNLNLATSCESVGGPALTSHEISVSGVTPSQRGPIDAAVLVTTDSEDQSVISILVTGFIGKE